MTVFTSRFSRLPVTIFRGHSFYLGLYISFHRGFHCYGTVFQILPYLLYHRLDHEALGMIRHGIYEGAAKIENDFKRRLDLYPYLD